LRRGINAGPFLLSLVAGYVMLFGRLGSIDPHRQTKDCKLRDPQTLPRREITNIAPISNHEPLNANQTERIQWINN
jgi:hypothetical protein